MWEHDSMPQVEGAVHKNVFVGAAETQFCKLGGVVKTIEMYCLIAPEAGAQVKALAR